MIKKMLMLSVAAAMLAACSEAEEPSGDSSKEAAFKAAVATYVDQTVRPTYAAMADAAITLHECALEIQAKHAAGSLQQADVDAAAQAWRTSRKHWELSEAFLFGPAANHNIDPHIDSWPLDKAAMDELLTLIHRNHNWSLENNGGYGLIGFHSVEYILFALTPTDYSAEHLTYLTAVTEDLRNQAVCLEACWAGQDNLSSLKQQILEDADLDYGENYGDEMKYASQPGSRFKTYQACAEEILQGCIDIADEVGNTKIGRPHSAASEQDKNYIESPYSLNSIEDFADNIISIRRSLDCGLSTWLTQVNPDLNSRLNAAIDAALADIRAIPEPFAVSASGPQAAKAVKSVGEDLVNVLQEAYNTVVSHE